MTPTHVNVAIIGAGVSGIGIACHVRRSHPDRSIMIFERRDAIGGTWDLFRYPGIRCDSDMYTFGYSFRPWPNDHVITDGESIRTYVTETAAEYGVDRDIRFRHKVEHVSWSTDDTRWTITALNEQTGEPVTVTADFLVSCTGYYSYDEGHAPTFEGTEDFAGDIVHPQFWPEDLDYTGKKVVVIGSGATAVTLVPNMTDKAAHVTMLQRSPTYVLSLPEVDPISPHLKKVLPADWVSSVTRVRNLAIQLALWNASKRWPEQVKRLILAGVRAQVGPDVDMRHFTPDYDPWDERLCVVPNGDLFRVLRRGEASIVTDHIDRFTKDGILLASGERIEADIIVTATGLKIELMGGISGDIDGEHVKVTDRLTYKAMMVSDVPNFALLIGYVNASWTRKVDHVGEYLGRLLAEMDTKGMRMVTPRADGAVIADEPFIDMKSGYVQRGMDMMPLQGERPPWRNSQNLLRDWLALRFGKVDDGHLEFSKPVDGSRGRRAPVPTPANVVRLATRPVRGVLTRLAS